MRISAELRQAMYVVKSAVACPSRVANLGRCSLALTYTATPLRKATPPLPWPIIISALPT